MSPNILKDTSTLKPEDLIFLPKQIDMINALSNGCNKIFFEGSIRGGKSLITAYLIDYICSHTIGMQFYVFRDTFESIKNDTHRIFIDIPGFSRGKAKLQDLGRKLYYHNTQSTVHFMHSKNSDLRGNTQGITAGGLFFEQLETISERDFEIILPRLSQWGPKAIADYKIKYKSLIDDGKILIPRNYLFMTANPRAGWLKSRYIDTDVNLKKENITRISTAIYDNLKNLGPEYENLINTSSTAFKKQYFDGDWTLNSGLIYSEFNALDIEDGGNVVNAEWEKMNSFNPSKYRTILAIDPGYVKSKYACLYASVLTDGTLYIFDEVVKNGKSKEDWEKVGPDEVCLELKKKNEIWKMKPDLNIIDSAAKDPNGGMGSIAGRMIKNGIPVISAKKGKEYDSILIIKSLFKSKKILVNARCQGFIQELGLFRWDERKVISGDQKPVDDDNDFCDCCRYIYSALPSVKVFPADYETTFKQNFDPEKQMAGFMKSCMPVKTKKTNSRDWGLS